MKRKIVFLLLLIGVIGVVIAAVRFFSGRTPKQGVLKVATSPQVSIFLNEKHIGRTPYEDKVEAGEYTIKLVPESPVSAATSWQGKISVSANLLTFVNAELTESDFSTSVDILWLEKISSKQSEIALTTNPDGASVSLDGEPKGNTPIVISDVVPGDHTVAIASTGFAPRTIKVKTTSGYKLIATVKLALTPSVASGSESVATESADIAEKPIQTPSPTGKAGQTPMPTEKGRPSPTVTPAKSDPEKPYIVIQDTPTGFLRVRMEPTTSATEAARVNPGDRFHVLETQDGWYRIEYDGENEGWVSGQYADIVE